jgi:hypothetical protein
MGATSENLIEVFGALDQHDELDTPATEELRSDTRVLSRPGTPAGSSGKS